MRDDDTLVVTRGTRGQEHMLWIGAADGSTILYFVDHLGDWSVHRCTDGKRIAVVRGNGLGGVSRSHPLDANHLARVVANLDAGENVRAALLAKGFISRHRSIVFGKEDAHVEA